MQAVVLGFQLLEGAQAVVRDVAGTGGSVFIDLEHGGLFAVQAGEAVGGVVDDLHVRHIGQAHVAVAVHMQQQGTSNVIHAVVLLADFQQPGLAAGVLHIACRHGEVLGVDQGGQGVDVQLLLHIRLGQRLGAGRLVLLLGLFQLLFVLVELLAGLGKLHVGIELLLGKAAQCTGEGAHELRHIVHGLDGIFQRAVDHLQALLQLQLVRQISSAAALRTGLGVHPLLQLLQGIGELVGHVTQFRHDLDQGVDVPHAGVVELVQHLLQTLLHLDQCLLDLRLLDHGNELVHAFHQRPGLLAHHIHRVAYLGAHGGQHRVGHGVAKVLHLPVVFGAAGGDLAFRTVQLGTGVRQFGVDQVQQLGVDLVDLVLIQLHLHQLFHQTAGRHIGHAALALHIGHQRVLDQLRHLVDVAALPAHRHGHEGVHVQAVLNDGGSQAAAGQVALGLIQLVGHLHQGTVHVGIIGEVHQQQAVVLRRGGRDVLYTGHREGVLQHVRHFALHTLRAGTRVYGDHHQIRRADVGQQIGLHLRDGHKAQDQHHHHGHQHREWLFDTEFFHFSYRFPAMHRSTAVIPRKGRSHFNIPIIHRRCKVATDPTAFFRKTFNLCRLFGTKFRHTPPEIRSGGPDHCTGRILFFAWKCAFKYGILEFRMEQ